MEEYAKLIWNESDRSNLVCPEASEVRPGELPPVVSSRLVTNPTGHTFVLDDCPNEADSVGNSIQPKFLASTDELRTIVHDFTFACLQDCKTDVRLQDRFDRVGDSLDHLSPDAIFDIAMANGEVLTVVHEYTTRHDSVSIETLYRAFREKRDKYYGALLARCSSIKKVVFFVTVVTPNVVVSNCPYTLFDVKELCYRNIVSRQMQSQVLQRFPELDREEDSNAVSVSKSLFAQIKLPWTCGVETHPNMSEEVYKAAIAPLTNEELSQVEKMIIRVCSKSFENYAEENKIKKEYTKKQALDEVVKEGYAKVENWRKAIIDKGCQSKDANKTICQMPLIVMQPTLPTSNLTKPDGSPFLPVDLKMKETPTGWLWFKAIKEIRCGRMVVMDEDVEFLKEMSLVNTELPTKSAKSREYRRVHVEISAEEKMKLAEHGLYSKLFSSEEVKEKNIMKKKSLHPQTDVSDVDHFVFKSSKDFLAVNTERTSRDNILLDLVRDSLRLHHPEKGASDQLTLSMSEFMTTDIMRACSFISDVASELAMGRAHITPGTTFSVKKVRHWNAYLLIKNTRIDNHTFYSIAFPKTALIKDLNHGKVFRTLIDGGDIWYTEFSSAKTSKLTNTLKLDCTCLTMTAFWLEQNGCPFWMRWEPEMKSFVESALKMVAISLIVAVNDKTGTEEMMTLSRYVMMEGFRGDPDLPNPYKMVEKFRSVIRSRMEVWVINNLCSSMEAICEVGGFVVGVDKDAVDKEESIHWRDLFNPYTGESLPDPYRLVNCFYLGYLKNKEETTEKNQIALLYEKILSYEDKLDRTSRFLGRENPTEDTIKDHEFSPLLVKYLTDKLIEKGIRMRGQNFLEDVERSIHRAIGYEKMDNLGTLKASSTFNAKDYLYSKNSKYSRVKAAEALLGYSKECTSYTQLLHKSLLDLESRGCLHIDIFKKMQHGGLREIYVLEFPARVVQLALEKIARCIASCFPSETMCTPSSKQDIPIAHKTAIKKEKGSYHTTCTSDDAKKWNQGHYVGKFALMLCRLTPKECHGFIWRACKLFLKKRMMIDPRLMDCIVKGYDELYSNNILRKMVMAFHGKEPQVWMPKGLCYIETESGMMQGILHYTSSLFHTILQEWLQIFFTAKMNQFLVNHSCKPGAVCHVMQSSDDSCVLLSWPKPESTHDKYMASMRAGSFFQFKKELGVLLGIYSSPKSTCNTPWMFEFNSEFIFYSNTFRPTIRWVAAVNTITESESILARQEEMASNLTSVLEGGGSLSLTHLCQWSQAILHYRLLGLFNHPLAYMFSENIKAVKDPSVGYFLMDHVFAAGLAGMRYNLWNAAHKSALGTKFNLMLAGKLPDWSTSTVKDLGGGILGSGGVTGGFALLWGDRKRWTKMIERSGVRRDWVSVSDEDPSLLYIREATRESFEIKMAEKLHSPGVVSSISNGNSAAKVMAASAYILSHQCVSVTDSYYDDKVKNRVSLLWGIHAVKTLIKDPKDKSKTFLSSKAEDLLFPFASDYHDFQSNLIQFDDIEGVVVHGRMRKTNTRIAITGSSLPFQVKPEDLIVFKWFGEDYTNVSAGMKERFWSELCAQIKWLKDDIKATLEGSPFDHQYQLRNFFSRMDYSVRKVKISGAPVNSIGGWCSVRSMILKNFFPGMILSMDETPIPVLQGHKSLKSTIVLLESDLFADKLKADLFKTILKEADQIPTREVLARNRTKRLSIMQSIIKADRGEALKNVLLEVTAARQGVIGGYTQKQFWSDVVMNFVGEGTWSGHLDGSQFRVHLKGSYIKREDGSVAYKNEITDIVVVDRRSILDVIRWTRSYAFMNNLSFAAYNFCDCIKTRRLAAEHTLVSMVTEVTAGPTGKGTPCYVCADLPSRFDYDMIMGWDVTYKRGVYTLSLQENAFTEIKKRGKQTEQKPIWTPVMTYVAKSIDYEKSHRMDSDLLEKVSEEHVLPRIQKVWLSGEDMPKKGWLKLADLINENKPLKSFEGLNAESTMRLLSSRVRRKLFKMAGLGNLMKESAEDHQVADTVVERKEYEFDEADFDKMDAYFEEKLTNLENDGGASYLDSFDIMESEIDVDAFAYAKPAREDVGSTLLAHPLGDSIVEYIFSIVRYQAERLLTKGEVKDSDVKKISEIAPLIDMKPSDIRPIIPIVEEEEEEDEDSYDDL